jgi:Yip1 domain
MSLAGRLMNIFAAPGDVFDEIKTAPHRAANWLTPALLLIVLSWMSCWLIFSQPSIQQQMKDISNQAIDRQVEKGKLTSAQADQARAAAEKFGGLGYKIGGVVGPVFMAFISPFWGGLILWLVGSFALKAPFPYLKAVEIAGLANMILVLDVVVRTLLVLITGNLFATLSLTLVLKDFDPQNTFHSLLALINVMTIWLLAVRSIGLARLTGASVAKAAIWIFGIWIILSGILIGFGAAMRAAFGG